VSEQTSLLEKKKHKKAVGNKSREPCPSILNFFKLLDEMEKSKSFDKSGNYIFKGPIGSNIDGDYHIIINPGIEAENPELPASKKLIPKKKLKSRL
jgi:hypothetical protein